MLFMPALAEKIALAEKTQTRRPITPGEQLLIVDGIKRVLTVSGKLKHAVGSVRSMPYGRGLPTRWWHPTTCHLLDYEEYRNVLAMYGKTKAANALRDEGFVPFKMQILDINEEADVRDISHLDAVAEGFEFESIAKHQFLQTWMMLYDPTFMYRWQSTEFTGKYDTADFNHCPAWLWDRPAHKYGPAFVYTFKIHVEH